MILICFLKIQINTIFFMGRIKTDRFTIDESSWNYDISSSISTLLEMIPENDKEIDIPDVLYKGLSANVEGRKIGLII